jgi:hypothetical protein
VVLGGRAQESREVAVAVAAAGTKEREVEEGRGRHEQRRWFDLGGAFVAGEKSPLLKVFLFSWSPL